MKPFEHTIVLLMTLFVLGCGDSKTTKEIETGVENSQEKELIKVSKEQFEKSGMRIGAISEQDFPQVVETRGTIDVPPQNRAVISTFAGGYVQKTPLLIGDKVRKGQVLLTLENPEFVEMQQHYLEVSEQLTFLKSEFERQRTLVEEKISSEKNFLRAQSNYKRELARYNGLKKKLEMLNINIKDVESGSIASTVTLYAPIHGNVTKINISTGTYVSPSDEIMEIINTDHIHLELAVFEKDILQVKEGQKILFRLPEAIEDTFEADVHLVGTSIDPINRTVKIHGHLDSDLAHTFAVGMFVDAQIVTRSGKGTALPNDAVVSTDQGTFVLALQSSDAGEYTFAPKAVSVGPTFNGYTMITTAVSDMEVTYLTEGAFNLMLESGGPEH